MEYIISQIGSKNSPVIIELKEFEGRKLFDIRKYFIDKKSNELTPTRKGISLNSFQLTQLIETINSKSKVINDFLLNDENEKSEIFTELKFDNLIGRVFKYDFSNGKNTIILDEIFFKNLNMNELEVIKKMLLSFNSAIFDIFDDQTQIELILDILDQKIKKTQW
jgi:hypothetical protein